MVDQELHRGLEGIAVAETRLSTIDGEAGELIIGGYPVEELAKNAIYEESVFLLFNDRLPTKSELESFCTELAGYRKISKEVKQVLRQAARENADAMDALRMGVAAANLSFDLTESTDHAKRLVSVIPTIVTTYCDIARVKSRWIHATTSATLRTTSICFPVKSPTPQL